MKNNDELPEGWKNIPFLKAAIVVSDEGKRVKQRDYLLEGKIPVIDQGHDFIGGYIDDENMAFKGDLPVIIFGDHTRNIKYVNRRFAVGAEGVKILKPESCYEPKFFYYMLHSLEIPSRGYSRHFQFLKKFDFPLAPYDVQKLIVSEIEKQFSRLDEAVAALKRVRAGLKRYKASVLKAAVEGNLTEEWREKNVGAGPWACPDSSKGQPLGVAPTKDKTGAELLNRILAERKKKWEEKNPGKKYKEPSDPDTSNLPELPEGWVWATLQQIFQTVTDGDHQPPPQTKCGVPFLVIGNVRTGKLDFADTRYVSQEYFTQISEERIPRKGDILYTLVGSYGIALLVDTAREFCIQRHIAILKPTRSLNIHYLKHGLNTAFAYRQAVEIATGTAQKTVPLAGLREMAVPFPSLQEQQKIIEEIESRLSVAEEVETSIDINLKRAERLRQAILKKAFSGRLIDADQNGNKMRERTTSQSIQRGAK